jgi:hypothetical protein
VGLLSGFGNDAFIPNQKILAFWIVEMLLKEPVKKFRPGHDRTEEALHRPVTATFSRPAGNAQHRYSAGHAQDRFDDPAHSPHIRFRQIWLYSL